ncbi:MAG: 3-methyl-2-oxobutanoate hydroxymethyltransferase [Gammaproteobacteria bacterium]|nr:3-methyl-2-oxobutanoate hydroxymethyltransferase [Gammaproteobacteria bacterium]
MKKISTHSLMKKHINGEKITMITCYDYTSAQIIEQTDIDCVLIGDSAAMVMYGHDDTTSATVEMIATHTRAVAKGIKSKLIIGDLPFMSYHKSSRDTMIAVETLMRAGAHTIKLEGIHGNEQTIKQIIAAGIPVMAHIGLTPQHIHKLGGFKVQGKDESSCQELIEQAKIAEALGCFAMVLECMPAPLATEITQTVNIPTIGIGAGSGTDGQVLVFQDLLGLQSVLKPKFLKHYLDGEALLKNSINQYVNEVVNKKFPSEEYSY